jgi:hypothetical protein
VAGRSAADSALAVERERQVGQRQVEADRVTRDDRRHVAELRRPLYEELIILTYKWDRWVNLTKPFHGAQSDALPLPGVEDDLESLRGRLAVVGSQQMVARFRDWEEALRDFGYALAYLADVERSTSDAEPDPEPWAQLRDRRAAVHQAQAALAHQAAQDVQEG